jgi:hypothetical protein
LTDSHELDIDHLLQERFARRSLLVDPVADPGSQIMARAAAALARRRRRRVTAVSASAGLLALLGVVALGHRASDRHLSTAGGTTTTTTLPTGWCAVSNSACEPTSVSIFTVGSPPSGYTPASPGPTVSQAPPENQAEKRYVDNSHLGVVNTEPSFDVTITTATESETSANIAEVSSTWTVTSVGSRAGYATTVSKGSGPGTAPETLLVVQLSPTVSMLLDGSALSTSQLVGIANSISFPNQ